MLNLAIVLELGAPKSNSKPNRALNTAKLEDKLLLALSNNIPIVVYRRLRQL